MFEEHIEENYCGYSKGKKKKIQHISRVDRRSEFSKTIL